MRLSVLLKRLREDQTGGHCSEGAVRREVFPLPGRRAQAGASAVLKGVCLQPNGNQLTDTENELMGGDAAWGEAGPKGGGADPQ